MYITIVRLILIATLLVTNAETKKVKKYTKEDDSTPQPTVVTYSTFGFNDVVSNGFVPSSPDFLTQINGYNQDVPTRLYAPAFPSAPDTESNNYNYNSQTATQSEATYNIADSGHKASIPYKPNFMNFYDASNFDSKSSAFADNNDQAFADSSVVPIYGTKINESKVKNNLYPYNDTEKNINFEPIDASGNSYLNFLASNSNNKPKSSLKQEFGSNEGVNYYVGSYSAPDDSQQIAHTGGSIKFPKVIDFTKINQNSPLELDTKYGTDINPNQINYQNEVLNSHKHETQKYKKNTKPVESKKYGYDNKDEYTDNTTLNNFYNQLSVHNYLSDSVDTNNVFKGTKITADYKDKLGSKPLVISNEHNIWQKPLQEYDHKYSYSENGYKKKHKKLNLSVDEVVPESSNNIDIATSSLSDIDFTSFKKIPGVTAHYEDDFRKHIDGESENDDYIKQLNKLYGSSTSSSKWGNIFTQTDEDYSTSNRLSKPYFSKDVNSDIVHIPKKHSFKSFEPETKVNDWGFISKPKPYKSSSSDWNEDIINNRFKSEEDLLGLRNYYPYSSLSLPSYKPMKDVISPAEYKKIADKWKLSYLKAKYKDYRNNVASYASEDRPVHVPVPAPYPIEVPRPVIVAVPQPYPVRVPVPRPVAVPVVREIKVPIEKPVPYPVIKNVPYPIEKPVPVPVEIQVPVPVMKPYPVMVPRVRPVFHYSKHREELEEDADDYLPRPESTDIRATNKHVPHFKRPYSWWSQTRRPLARAPGSRPRRPARDRGGARSRPARALPPC